MQWNALLSAAALASSPDPTLCLCTHGPGAPSASFPLGMTVPGVGMHDFIPEPGHHPEPGPSPGSMSLKLLRPPMLGRAPCRRVWRFSFFACFLGWFLLTKEVVLVQTQILPCLVLVLPGRWIGPLRLAPCPAEFLGATGGHEGLLARPLNCWRGGRVRPACC